jgi:uncharacterized OB-fold protein
LCPALEHDPDTGAAAEPDLVEVGPEGEITSWTWVEEPFHTHPLDTPFAFALIKLDGADTAMVHAVDAGSAEKMSTGMKVQPRWRAEPQNRIDDLACWEPVA